MSWEPESSKGVSPRLPETIVLAIRERDGPGTGPLILSIAACPEELAADLSRKQWKLHALRELRPKAEWHLRECELMLFNRLHGITGEIGVHQLTCRRQSSIAALKQLDVMILAADAEARSAQ